MSVPVDLTALATTIAERRATPYLVTAGADGPPHLTAIGSGRGGLRWDDDVLVAAAGNTTARNVTVRREVSLLWPPDTDDGYSLIVDGAAEITDGPEGRQIRITPTHAILHRPARDPGPGDHPHDCQPIDDGS